MKRTSAVAVTAACTLLAAAVVGVAGAAAPKQSALPPLPAGTVRVVAKLDTVQVVPAPTGAVAGATGEFAATFDGAILRFSLGWAHLSGTATSAQIHLGRRKSPGPLVQPICVPCFFSPEDGVVPLLPWQVAALKVGRLYVSIQTDADPGGEIRGQLSIVK